MPKAEVECVRLVLNKAAEPNTKSATCHGAAQAIYDCLKTGGETKGKEWRNLIFQIAKLDSAVYRVNLHFSSMGKIKAGVIALSC